MMNKPAIAITRWIFSEIVQRLSTNARVTERTEDQPYTPEQLAHALAGRVGVLATVQDRFDAALLARPEASALKVISTIAVGFNNIDIAACTERGIAVTNTPDVLTETTADLTWALLMAAARRVTEAEAFLRRGEWQVAFAMNQMLGTDVYGKTLGIIGMGRIGQAIARRAQGFGMRIIYQNRSPINEIKASELNVSLVSQRTLLQESDFVVLMAPYSAATHHLIGAAELALMKPSAILVNTARGGVVDDAALIAALTAGGLRAAAIDVFEGEPKLNPGFLALKNVVLTPHIGSATEATRRAMAGMAADNLLAALAGQRPSCLVNQDVWRVG